VKTQLQLINILSHHPGIVFTELRVTDRFEGLVFDVRCLSHSGVQKLAQVQA
jgi:hypothetical protein